MHLNTDEKVLVRRRRMNPNAVTKNQREKQSESGVLNSDFFWLLFNVMYYTYVLRSAVKNILYKGSTEDIQRRLLEHNSGMTNFTSKYRPWELVYFETFPTRSEAIRREKFFKTGRGREFLHEVISSKGKK